MPVDPFIAPDQVLLEILWNVLLVLTLCALGLFASVALLVLASCAVEGEGQPDDAGRPARANLRLVPSRTSR